MFQKLLIEVENYTMKCELFIINLYIYILIHLKTCQIIRIFIMLLNRILQKY